MSEQILIVDDDEYVLTGLTADLEEAGYQVHAVSSGEQALDVISNRPVGLVLCDLVMDGIDGMELLKRVRAFRPNIAFIIITGHGTIGHALEAIRHGASDFIQKPTSPDVIRHRVRQVLDAVKLRHNLVSERRRLEERKRESQERLIRDERMVSMGRLADGISHYLSDILEPIIQYPETLKSMVAGDSPLHPYLDRLEHAGRKSAMLIRDLQTIGLHVATEKEGLDLSRVVLDFMQSSTRNLLCRNHPGVFIDYQPMDSVPAIQGCYAPLYTALVNLVVYCVEGMPDGGRVSITLSSEEVDSSRLPGDETASGYFVVLRVSDSGEGVAAVPRERIFEPFQIRNIGGRNINTGLTLSVVYRVVQDHHGFMDVKTCEGKGTEFTLYFPVDKDVVMRRREAVTDYTGHETILVVDDYREHREVAVGILQGLGYHVISVDSGRAAVEMVKSIKKKGGSESVDLLVLDLVLGDAFDGLETYKKILEVAPEQRAVLVSGFAEFSRIVEARKLGLTQYVQKPYRVETLGKAVRVELDKR